MNLDAERLTGELSLRYEDLAQDGRLQVGTLPVSLGVIWRKLLAPGEIRAALVAHGVIPILTRLSVEGAPGPFAVDDPLEVEGGYALAHDVDGEGKVARLLLDMDTTLWGRKGRTNLPPPPDKGARAPAGRVRAEHVFTRPFAPPGERKVLALEVGGTPFVPQARRRWESAHSVLEVPRDAEPLEAAFTEDAAPLCLGVTHTDSNQHVNSLVYPRMFEEAALRHLSSLGRPTAVLAREIEVGYRRPSFAGERLRVVLRAFRQGERSVCTGAFFGEGEDPRELSRARVFVRMTLEE